MVSAGDRPNEVRQDFARSWTTRPTWWTHRTKARGQPQADKNHGEKCGIADYDSGIHADRGQRGRSAKLAICTIVGKQTLDTNTKKAKNGMHRPSHARRTRGWEILLLESGALQDTTKLPLPFYIDKSADSKYVWFNSITSDQMGYLDVARFGSNAGPTSVPLPQLRGSESARASAQRMCVRAASSSLTTGP